ncbi:cilia- and flagella-associated protein 44-like [Macrosteles quadrilineatus]|uniref:cilia- and flagella-associated protein 44-like n=1 Tax=Macrosteles quadrilineatus TaxID=74068 RepID=UPI0023E178CA|nr:cilia- and flagella-associated protein 44-like [Macrosteles quadrilineatus]
MSLDKYIGESESGQTSAVTSNERLILLHSLGYECQRYSNLCVADERWLIFSSGSLVHMLDTQTGKLRTRPSDRGCCIGHVTKNPTHPHIAVGEKVSNPLIIIYNWPSFEVVKKLANGTESGYVFLTYSPDGRILCSQGGGPDYSMTLWDWESSTVIARSSSPQTLRVFFSSFADNCIIACGDEGVRFWELTKTYTGLKLLSQKGRFNVLDESQVLAVFCMPDGQMVSGCSWGNILVWADGRVIMEACQRNRQPCHDSAIVNFTYNQEIDELCTVGMDGCIKMWHYGRFKLDPFSDDMIVVIKPVFEIQVRDERGFSVISYILKKNCDQNDSIWFAQDRNGGLWQVDMQVSAATASPLRLYSCHAGPVCSLASSPWSPTLASLAANGVLHIYNLTTGKLLAIKEFEIGGSKLYWFLIQEKVEEEIIALGFADGSVKLISLTEAGTCITIKQLLTELRNEDPAEYRACLRMSPESFDALLELIEPVITKQDTTMRPALGAVDTEDYNLGQFLPGCWRQETNGLQSVVRIGSHQQTKKAKQKRDAYKRYFVGEGAVHWQLKMETKPHKGRITAICVNPEKTLFVTGSEDRSVFVYKLQSTIQLIPVGFLQLEAPVRGLCWNPTQIRILLVCCVSSLSEVVIPEEGFTGISYQLSPPISTEFPKYQGPNLLLNESSTWYLGLENGKLRCLTKVAQAWLATGYDDIRLHDIDYGMITDITVSNRFRFLVDCGMDGNIFVFSLETETETFSDESLGTVMQITTGSELVLEEEPGVSLEEAKKDAVIKEKMAVAMMKKVRVQKQLAVLRTKYRLLLEKNAALPDSQRLRYSEFRLDKRLQLHIQELIDKEMKLVKHKLNFEVQKSQLCLYKMKHYFMDCLAAFHVEISAIGGRRSISTFVHRKLGEDFEQGEAFIKRVLQNSCEKIRDTGTESLQKAVPELSPVFILEVESEEPYQRSVQDIYDRLNIKTKRALEKHKLTKQKKEERKKQWQAFLATQPDQDKNLSTDISAIEHAMRTIGDYKLKSSEEFKLPDQSKNTSLHKLNQLVQAKREIFNMKEEFNRKVYSLREKKVKLVRNVHQLENQLLYLYDELPEDCRILPPPKPQLNIPKEFPERQYQIYPDKDPDFCDHDPIEYEEEFFILNSQSTLMVVNDEGNTIELEEEESEWESEIRSVRKTRQLFKQDQILSEMARLLTQFDQEVELLARQRLQLSIDIKYLECFVNLLHQEFHIMHSFDEAESAIMERVNNSLAEKHTKHLRINILQHKIDVRAAEVALLEEKLAAVEKIFAELTANCRVGKHLNRIFRKKSRPNLFGSSEEEEGESDEDSSSETSEDSDTTVSVGRPSPRRKDGKCPAECDPQIHKETVQLRAKRYKLEAKINTEKNTIDLMRREKERNYKFLKLIEPVLRMNQDQLEKLQKDKQSRLNETEVLVVLRCGQICGRSLLMSRPELDKLRARVSELQRQTDSQLEKLRKSQRYQQRLTEECLEMESKISQLKKDIDKAMICKFGQQVDVETLEEKSLEQMIKNIRKSKREEELHRKYEKIIRDLKEELLEESEDLADLMRENTHKLQMLSSLEEEKQKLITLTQRVKKAATDSNDREKEYIEDVRSLTKILHNQILQKETIIHEIKVLTLKGRPLPPIPPPSIVEEQTKSTTAQTQSFRDSDDLASTECQTREGSPGFPRAATPGFPRGVYPQKEEDEEVEEQDVEDLEKKNRELEDQEDEREQSTSTDSHEEENAD